MMHRIVFLVFTLLFMNLPERLLAGGQFACLLGPTGNTICAKVIVEKQQFYIPLTVLKILGVRYTVNGSTLKIAGDKPQSITLVEKSGAKTMRLDDLAKALDADYSFDENAAAVSLFARLKSVKLEGSAVCARFSLEVLAPSAYTLDKPARIVLDVQGARLAAVSRQIDVKRGSLKGIRLGQPSQCIARIVLDMAKDVPFRVVPGSSTREIRLELGSPAVSVKSLKGVVVVIDPGHGGNDPGALAEGVLEKDLDLAIAKTLKPKIAEAGAKVILTREDDTFVDLEGRPAVATQNAAGIFISLHCNAAAASNATGIETYCSQFPGSDELGAAVQAALIKATGAVDRHARPDPGLIVLQGVNCPSILVECGFIDSETECKLLCDGTYRNKLARAVVDGIVAYRKTAAKR